MKLGWDWDGIGMGLGWDWMVGSWWEANGLLRALEGSTPSTTVHRGLTLNGTTRIRGIRNAAPRHPERAATSWERPSPRNPKQLKNHEAISKHPQKSCKINNQFFNIQIKSWTNLSEFFKNPSKIPENHQNLSQILKNLRKIPKSFKIP